MAPYIIEANAELGRYFENKDVIDRKLEGKHSLITLKPPLLDAKMTPVLLWNLQTTNLRKYMPGYHTNFHSLQVKTATFIPAHVSTLLERTKNPLPTE